MLWQSRQGVDRICSTFVTQLKHTSNFVFSYRKPNQNPWEDWKPVLDSLEPHTC